MAKKEGQLLSPEETTKVAQELFSLDSDKQISAINTICENSIENGVKVTIKVLEIIKKTNEETNEGNRQFIELCEKGISTLEGSLADGKISEEEKKNIHGKIMDILIMANDSTNRTRDTNKELAEKAIKHGAYVVGGVTAFSILLIFTNALIKSLKK